MFKAKVKRLMEKVHALKNGVSSNEDKIAGNVWLLSADEVLCCKREDGDSRYPYSCDGRILWASASGVISVAESLFTIFLNAYEGKEPYLCFFAGQKRETGYFPISLLGVARQAFEENVERYTVFTPEAAYYFTETETFVACVRVFMDTKKRLCFSTYIENVSAKVIETYVSSYFNPLLLHGSGESPAQKWYKSCTRTDYGFLCKTLEYFSREEYVKNCLAIRVEGAKNIQTTTSRSEYTGGINNSLHCATPLQTGKFKERKAYTEFVDLAVAGSLTPLKLKVGEYYVENYVVGVSSESEETAVSLVNQKCDLDQTIYNAELERENSETKKLNIRFSGLQDALKNRDTIFNNFLYNVTRQVDFCVHAKNYAGAMMGIRDLFQQVGAAIAWTPKYCRGKIIEALDFIGEDGRAPRQYSYPAKKDVLPMMDLRPFIDQGVWIISTLYTYLAYTNDYSILEETCGYYRFEGGRVAFSDKRDTVLEHLLAIADYLVSNLDEDTGCLKALFGDWNDALDGLGATNKEGREYGNGVSVMASLQFYRNLLEMSEICRKTGKHKAKAEEYLQIRESLKKGLIKNAIVQNEKGERKVLHGWGDDRSFFVGSYCDNDGRNRDGLTASAYWILSDLYKEYGEIVPDIVKAYDRLDSKYGLKTFEPYFAPENTQVGRISRMPKGTAENGATYIHATLFGIWSLFEIGESKRAWEQIYKILPITHDFISTTPFVMSNSYVYNAEKGFDGQSMNDWFTGSGCVLMKVLIGGVFGVRPTLDGLTIQMAEYMPCDYAEISLRIKDTPLRVRYKRTGQGRGYSVNGKKYLAKNGIFLSLDDLKGEPLTVEIVD